MFKSRVFEGLEWMAKVETCLSNSLEAFVLTNKFSTKKYRISAVLIQKIT